MDRRIVYAGQEVLETDLLYAEKYAYEGIAKLAETVLGQAQVASGFACVPGSGLQVAIDRGALYDFLAMDTTAYSAVPSDSHTILKQGLLRDATTLALAAPGTAGQSVIYLIQAQIALSDGGSTVLPYYNSSDPSVPYSGPGNSGASQSTVRMDGVTLQAKAGTAAVTGRQSPPTADAGFYPLWVVTVANGQSSIAAGNIAKAPRSILLSRTLPRLRAPSNANRFARGELI